MYKLIIISLLLSSIEFPSANYTTNSWICPRIRALLISLAWPAAGDYNRLVPGHFFLQFFNRTPESVRAARGIPQDRRPEDMLAAAAGTRAQHQNAGCPQDILPAGMNVLLASAERSVPGAYSRPT